MRDERTGNVFDMNRPKSSILDRLDQAADAEEEDAPEPAEEEAVDAEADSALVDTDLLPQPGDPYKAHARPGNKPESTLHLLFKEGHTRGFSWASFDSVDLVPSERPGEAPGLVVRFACLVPTEVIIAGRNLGKLHVYLGQNRLAWMRELPKGKMLQNREAPVITGLSVRPVAK